ncbi:phage portal protein, PBSX family [Serratia ficaria]|uniref:phage portal protein n=1 Tax=Serratia ficaria TaxID=61651 RepID=UPI00218373D9|nr:phage portal protein [Serratia ficaria]CAI2469538.1 phage portal protein, PBSX family [Serratia ficaria]
MKKKKRQQQRRQGGKQFSAMPAMTGGKPGSVVFGPPEMVLTSGTDYQDVWYDSDFDHWTQPIDRLALANLVNSNGQHGGVIYARRNMMSADYRSGGLSHEELKAAAFDFTTFGDAGLLKVRNYFGEVIRLAPLPSLYLRVRKDDSFALLQKGAPLIYDPEDVIFVKQYDPQQQVYGLPDYIGGINSALLNSEATIFRRRYYHNGAHMGGILYTTDANLSDEMEDEIKQKVEQSKGIGNFRNLYINIPKGDPEGVKFISVGDIGAKDEFASVKNISAQDILNAHRFPAGLAGIIPENAGGLGDPVKARETYRKDEVIPLQKMFMNAVNTDPEIPEKLHLQFNIETTQGATDE